MKAFALFHVIMSTIALGGYLASKPGQPREPHTAGEILFGLAFSVAVAAWGIYLLLQTTN